MQRLLSKKKNKSIHLTTDLWSTAEADLRPQQRLR